MNPDPAPELDRELRARGHRVTRPRRAVWEVLAAADSHLTVEEVATRLAGDGHPPDLTSVYRTLALFEELGLARTNRLGDGEAGSWELAHPDEHFHLVCESCGTVDHHVGSLVADVREHLDRDHGFEVRQVELVVRGSCPACRARDS